MQNVGISKGKIQDIAKVTKALGVIDAIDASVYDAGPIWLTILIDSADFVLQLASQDARMLTFPRNCKSQDFKLLALKAIISMREEPVHP